jgi:RNA polymerase sigma-70 factor (ECF subfamily)
MKVWKTRSHLDSVELAPALQSDLPLVAGAAKPANRVALSELPLNFTSVYDQYFDDVLRWVRAFGGAEAELEDLAQEVFVVVRRKLGSFDGGNLPGWLYKIAKLTVRDRSHRAWFRRIFRGSHAVAFDEMPSAVGDPEAALETRENQRLFYRLVGKMSERLRETFLLYEIEGYSGEEIAGLQNIPVNTVWTRLHHARKEFLAKVKEHMPPSDKEGRS